MAEGTGVTKEPATDPFAPHFHAAGFTVLALDFRRLGESGGSPRQVVRVDDQLDDYRRPPSHFAATLPEVDPTTYRDLGVLAGRRPRTPGRRT